MLESLGREAGEGEGRLLRERGASMGCKATVGGASMGHGGKVRYIRGVGGWREMAILGPYGGWRAV